MMYVQPGDIVLIDTSKLSDKFAKITKPEKYKALVVWNEFNNQPLITKLDSWQPFWCTYQEIVEVLGHHNMDCCLLEAKSIPIMFSFSLNIEKEKLEKI